jgi:hypothetical protein
MLRVNAVKELPALLRMGEAGASDGEGLSDDRSVVDGRGAGCVPVPVGVRRIVISGDPIQIKVPVAAWAAASCSWSRDVYVSGGSGPRPAVMYSAPSLPLRMVPPRFGCATEADLAWVGQVRLRKPDQRAPDLNTVGQSDTKEERSYEPGVTGIRRGRGYRPAGHAG